MNMLRVWGGGVYASEAFMDACDEMGIMVWHDFLYACGYYPDHDAIFMENITMEARKAIRRLRRHASLIGWAGNNEIQEMYRSQRQTFPALPWYGGTIYERILPALAQEMCPQLIYRESANNTLDAAYCDFCIAQIAQLLGKTALHEAYMRRSKSYRSLFDPAVGFLRGRRADGSFPSDFSPIRWGGAYCEGGAWQNGFNVPHDIEGLSALYGGHAGLEKKLDELFAAPPDFEIGTYPCEIHEMTEFSAADFGQCATSNEPSFHPSKQSKWMITTKKRNNRLCWTFC